MKRNVTLKKRVGRNKHNIIDAKIQNLEQKISASLLEKNGPK